MSYKPWTQEEIDYLESKVGFIKVSSIAKKLGRNPHAVQMKIDRMGIGNTKINTGKLTANSLANTLGVSYTVVYRWVKKCGLKATKRISREQRKFYFVDVNDFWEWAEKNKELINFSKIEKGSLIPEPEWVDSERLISKNKIPRKHRKGWSMEEERRLIALVNAKYKLATIAKMLERTETAIDRKVVELKARGRLPKKINVQWSEKEVELMYKLEKLGYSDKEIAVELGRQPKDVSEKRCRLRKRCIYRGFKKMRVKKQ